jgi:murein DD-endopeptidase MepM/ murein hydrolase activator NlpD
MKTRRSRSGRPRLLLKKIIISFIPLFLGIAFILWGIPQLDAYWESDGEHLADAAESTLAWFLTPKFGPEHVHLSLGLMSLASKEGVSHEDLKAIIAAAASETPRAGVRYNTWVNNSYKFAKLLLGLAKVESNYCRNIGGGKAIEELQKRLDSSTPEERSYWEANINALEEIAKRHHLAVDTIPGSIGAGAISCFQMMPTSWIGYGDGHFRNTYQAALNSARFLKAHGYPDNPEVAVRSYNFNAGEPYVNDVINSSLTWEFPVTTSLITEPYPIKVRNLVLVYLEFLAWYTGDYKVGAADFVFAGEFVHPYPGSVATSYFWLDPVYNENGEIVINHPGQDYGGIPSSPVVAAHNGVVTYAQYLSRHTSLAVKWWISGNVVVIRGNTEDGQPVCTFYGHGSDGTFGVSPGQHVIAGQFLMMSGTTGFIKVGGSGDHCEGGTWVDPNKFVK